MLGGIHRGHEMMKSDSQDNSDPEDLSNKTKEKKKKRCWADDGGLKTLEKEKNLEQKVYDFQMMSDPLFSKTTKMFDNMRASSLLASNLNVTPNLLLQFNSEVKDHLEIQSKVKNDMNFRDLTQNWA